MIKVHLAIWLLGWAIATSRCTSAGSSEKEPRIILGEQAKKGAYPGFTVISILGYRTCGGVLISKNVVLTAAHCLEIDGFDFAELSNDLGLLQVGRGNIRLQAYTRAFISSDETSSVKKIVVHPKYKFVSMTEVENDIAMLILEENFSKPYARVANKAPAPSAKSIAVGLGLSNDYSWPGPDGSMEIGAPKRLYQVGLTIGKIGKNPCPSEYDGAVINSTTSLCAYGEAVKGGFPSICWGDSGGPLYNTGGDVIGLTSWEPDACTDLATPFNIFTSAPYYKKKFIDRVVKRYA